jgi:excisionase family DNA binding protein
MNVEFVLPESLQSTMSQILAGLEAMQSTRPHSLVTYEGHAAVSVARAAAALDISESMVRKLINDGELGAVKAGSIWLIPAEEMQQFLGLKEDV